MRIVGGKNRRKTITPPPNFRARPTTDFAKENLFNVLSNYFDFDDVEVLDLFSGTGSISYEFCSREARRVVAIEMNPAHLKFIVDTARSLHFDQLTAIGSNVFVYLRTMAGARSEEARFDIIFADPPYDLDQVTEIPDIIFQGQFLKPDGWLIVEHSAARDFSGHPHYRETRKYGSVHFSVFV